MDNDSKLEKELSHRIEKENRRGLLSIILLPGSVYNRAILLNNVYSLEEKRKDKERAPEVKREMFAKYTTAIFIESVRLTLYGYIAMKIYESLNK